MEILQAKGATCAETRWQKGKGFGTEEQLGNIRVAQGQSLEEQSDTGR